MKRIKLKKNYAILFGILILLSIATLFVTVKKSGGKPEEVKYETFLEMIEADKVDEIIWTADDDKINFTNKKDKDFVTDNPKYDDFKRDMLEHGINVKEKGTFSKYETPIMLAFQIIIYAVFFSVLAKSTGLGIDVGQPKNGSTSDVKFADVAGLDEVKEDLMTVVDFLKNPDKYKDSGADIPKGILLYGPPGTGKTLLAKAIAGEAEVNFRSVSGSDFDEKYVGVGSSRMRKLFEDAKTNAPCIIFIDEIDSLGGRRHAKQTNSDRQTLNSLLSEMDGFDGSDGVVVIAATNRIEDLDSALTRPGRFDNHFAVNLPETAKERRVIINLYAANKKFADDVDMDLFAKETLGSSPAKIKTVLNEAAIMATRINNGVISKNILDEAWMKQLMEGHLKKNSDKQNIELVAWHEAGHALAGLLLGQDLTKASIIPSTSGAGGATFITPKKMGLFTKSELEDQVKMLYAGRNAEIILTNKNCSVVSGDCVTTGASNDIEKATSIIHQMITEYGMNEKFGLLNLDVLETKPETIMDEAIKTAAYLNEESMSLLWENKDVLEKIASKLMEKETLTGKEIKKIVEKDSEPKLKIEDMTFRPPDEYEHEIISKRVQKNGKKKLILLIIYCVISLILLVGTLLSADFSPISVFVSVVFICLVLFNIYQYRETSCIVNDILARDYQLASVQVHKIIPFYNSEPGIIMVNIKDENGNIYDYDFEFSRKLKKIYKKDNNFIVLKIKDKRYSIVYLKQRPMKQSPSNSVSD